MTDLYVDFLCPYAWRGVELAATLRGSERFRLRFFSLVEGNHADNAAALTWRITEQPLDAEGEGGYMVYQRPSLNAFLAALAAYEQGEELAWAFTLALYRAHHEEKRPLDEETFTAAAQQAGLNLPEWQAARQNEVALRTRLREELDSAAEVGVFGTPTFVLAGGNAAYYRFENLTRDPAQAQAWWKLFGDVLHSDAGIATIKRAKNRPAKKR